MSSPVPAPARNWREAKKPGVEVLTEDEWLKLVGGEGRRSV